MRAARLPAWSLLAPRVAAIVLVPVLATAAASGTESKAASGRSSATITGSQGDRAVPPAFASRAEMAKWTMAVLDGIFVRENRDEPWASAREAQIRGAGADSRLSGVDSIDVECRTSVCRVALGLDPTRARRTLLALMVTPPLNTSGFHGIDPDDDRKIRLFVAREGTVLMEHPALVQALRSNRDLAPEGRAPEQR
jgi:hypothetical protein